MSEIKDGLAPDTGENNQEQTTAETAPASDNSGHMIPKSRLDKEIEKRREAEKALSVIVELMKMDIPEQFRGLIPEGLSPQEKIEWMQKATRMGLFSGPALKSGPDAKRPGGKPSIEYDNLSPMQKMTLGYKKEK